MDWVPPNVSLEKCQAILEAVIPQCYWMKYNEANGSVGQIFRQPALEPTVRQVIESMPSSSQIKSGLLKWLETVKRKKGKRKRNTDTTMPESRMATRSSSQQEQTSQQIPEATSRVRRRR